ncbi:MAG TPA: PilT/PilU family type 4a pilus ATPase [Thermoanaerobaculia bacterium]|nr:PilT/PilU family type 4a pilus ATPase [Thermoanaerobaculia bacterium]
MAKKLIPDAQLEELVRELNRSTGEEGEGDPPAPSAGPVEKYLEEMAERGASDLLLVAGSPPVYRVKGVLVRAETAPFGNDEMDGVFSGVVTARVKRLLNERGAVDFSLRLGALRFRVNLHRQRGTLAAAVRALPAEIPTIAELNLPPALAELVKPTRGLVLVCGPTGAGKSTTLAALIGEINRNEARHIITIEDPVEYEHRNAKSLIEQVEIGRDSPTFADALRAALRQDPDVILVGEMRDLETMATAVTAAETGHLILSTLHTSDVAQAINRIIDVFPPEQQNQIRNQLSLALNAIVVQHLIPTTGGRGQAVAVELLLPNQAVRNHLRNNKLQNLASELTLGKRAGMISLEESLARLVQQGLISAEEARARSTRPDELASLIR